MRRQVVAKVIASQRDFFNAETAMLCWLRIQSVRSLANPQIADRITGAVQKEWPVGLWACPLREPQRHKKLPTPDPLGKAIDQKNRPVIGDMIAQPYGQAARQCAGIGAFQVVDCPVGNIPGARRCAPSGARIAAKSHHRSIPPSTAGMKLNRALISHFGKNPDRLDAIMPGFYLDFCRFLKRPRARPGAESCPRSFWEARYGTQPVAVVC
ncbi:MAG: hypothetical protein ACKODG_12315, partial [Betaproteobacteria bacterium]